MQEDDPIPVTAAAMLDGNEDTCYSIHNTILAVDLGFEAVMGKVTIVSSHSFYGILQLALGVFYSDTRKCRLDIHMHKIWLHTYRQRAY